MRTKSVPKKNAQRKYTDKVTSMSIAPRVRERIHYHKRTQSYGQLSQIGTFNGFAFSFQLNLVPDFTEFTSLYDVYRIDKICVHILPDATESLVSATNKASCNYFTVIDYDDGIAPTSVNDFLTRDNAVIRQFNEPAHISFRPHVPMATDTGLTVFGVNKQSQWIDCTFTNVFHYGLKLGLPATPATFSPTSFTIFIDYFMSFKSVR